MMIVLASFQLFSCIKTNFKRRIKRCFIKDCVTALVTSIVVNVITLQHYGIVPKLQLKKKSSNYILKVRRLHKNVIF